MRERLSMLNVKPTAAPRWRIASRFFCTCCSGMPYLRAMCSVVSSPSGAMPGFSSNGWKCSVTGTSGPRRSSAVSSAARPMAHQGQETSETKSIFMAEIQAGGGRIEPV